MKCRKGKKSTPVCYYKKNEKKKEDQLKEDEVDLEEAPCTSKSLFPSKDDNLSVSYVSSSDELDDDWSVIYRSKLTLIVTCIKMKSGT